MPGTPATADPWAEFTPTPTPAPTPAPAGAPWLKYQQQAAPAQAPGDPYAAFASPVSPAAATIAAPAGPWVKYQQQAAAGGDPYAAFASPVPQTGGVWNTAKDVAESAGSGLVKGATDLATLPITLQRGLDWATHKVWGADSPEVAAAKAPVDINAAIFRGQNALRGAENSALHTPTTAAGDFAQTAGEMLPTAFGGPESLAAKIMGNVAIPAAASTAAGEATKGTPLEPWARGVAALASNLGVGGIRAMADAPTRAVAAAVRSARPMDLAVAQNLQQTAQRVGVPLSGPEAVQAASGGATTLGDLQRVVEGGGKGASPLAAFYAARPAQIDVAGGKMLDAIAPAHANPSTIGPQAAITAEDVMSRVRQNINATTAPNYAAAASQRLAHGVFAPIGEDPAFQASLARLRADPVLGPTYQGQPADSVGVIDAVTKDMTAQGQTLGSTANPGFSPQKAAAYSAGAANARDIARAASPEYDAALAAQAAARAKSLNPLQDGPLGQVAKAGTTQQAVGALMPAQPLAGGQGEIGLASHLLATQDPNLVPTIMRQGLADQFDQATARLQSGPNQYGGARFAANVAGTAQQRANLAAALGAHPNAPAVQQAVDDTLNTFQATGMRQPKGTTTAFNTQYQRELGQPPLWASMAAAPASLGTSMVAKSRDALTNWALNRNTGKLADLFAAPDSVQQMAALAAQRAQTPLLDALRRGAVEAGAAFHQ